MITDVKQWKVYRDPKVFQVCPDFLETAVRISSEGFVIECITAPQLAAEESWAIKDYNEHEEGVVVAGPFDDLTTAKHAYVAFFVQHFEAGAQA